MITMLGGQSSFTTEELHMPETFSNTILIILIRIFSLSKAISIPNFQRKISDKCICGIYPFFVIGLLFLFRKREGKWWIIPLWLVVGIIPAAVARETPHALRTEATLPTWQIITAYGFVTVMLALRRFRKWVVSGFLFLLLLSVGYYLHGYYTHYPKEYGQEWQYGYKQAIEYVKAHQQQYDNVYIIGMARGYIYTLFYLKYPPREFRKTLPRHARRLGAQKHRSLRPHFLCRRRQETHFFCNQGVSHAVPMRSLRSRSTCTGNFRDAGDRSFGFFGTNKSIFI